VKDMSICMHVWLMVKGLKMTKVSETFSDIYDQGTFQNLYYESWSRI
jgi:hypothetical protein